MSRYYLINIEDIIETKNIRISFLEIMFPELIYLFKQKELLEKQEKNLKNNLKLLRCSLSIKKILKQYNIPDKLLFEVNENTICSREHLKDYITIFEEISLIPIDFELEKLKQYNVSEEKAKLYLKILLNLQKDRIADYMDKYDDRRVAAKNHQYKRIVI